ncbi:MAG: chorismate mutase [Spirochaetales bacterium]|uniref:chorismate mutase n=1 Tax=Candidatus Thalassospirochaeta sargassi TaxID=3119039 RepID=A0AAJ1IAT7_9SPIO|nr:chorismate mutase [Spirochaetales bacterium]
MTKAIRGAVQFKSDDKEIIKERVQFLLSRIMSENELDEENIISVFFSITSDLRSINPAAALRAGGGFSETPLFCAQEPDTEGAMPRAVRVMITCELEREKKDLVHIYIDGAEKLRPDLN